MPNLIVSRTVRNIRKSYITWYRDRHFLNIVVAVLITTNVIFATLLWGDLAKGADLLRVLGRGTAEKKEDSKIEAAEGWLDGENVRIVRLTDMNTSFFFVEDDTENGIDPVRNFLVLHERPLRRLVRHILWTGVDDSCNADATKRWGVPCGGVNNGSTWRRRHGSVKGHTDESVVVDVGANRGYYTLMAGSYGYDVRAYDGQPHCASLADAASLLSGLRPRIRFKTAMVSDKASSSATSAIRVKRRTGCTGTYPHDNHDGWAENFRRPLASLAGANDLLDVPILTLDDELRGVRDVALLKIDVEGAESAVLYGASNTLKRGIVRNIVVEFNKPMLVHKSGGLHAALNETVRVIRWLMDDLHFRSKGTHRGEWEDQGPMAISEWDEFLHWDGFTTVDAWFYK